jgi:hypothetical protein
MASSPSLKLALSASIAVSNALLVPDVCRLPCTASFGTGAARSGAGVRPAEGCLPLPFSPVAAALCA